jgi:hypothetical protein
MVELIGRLAGDAACLNVGGEALHFANDALRHLGEFCSFVFSYFFVFASIGRKVFALQSEILIAGCNQK